MWEKRDAKNNHRSYGMEQKLGSERRDNRTLSGTLNLDMFGVMGALKLITCVLTHGRKGCKRESNNCPHKDIAKGDAGLENVKDLEDCMRDERSSLMESVFILSCYRPRPKERSNDFVK